MAKISYQNDDLSILRALAIDTINKANSGHPGMAIGSAPIVETLFKEFLIANPKDSTWINRDRFVLSAGHASALLYCTLHLAGYKVSMHDLMSFRQIDSITPGHPEYHFTEGVDATSGPLGQGISQAVGLAIAERHINAILPDKYKDLVNHYTYCLCGDGCLQEGISQEAIELAGHLALNRLILFYDFNDVTLDGPLSNSASVSQELRFKAAGWNVIKVLNLSLNPSQEEIAKAIKKAKKSDKPTIIIVHTTIGLGSKKAGTSKVHGSPLGEEDGHYAKASYHYGHEDELFYVPESTYDNYDATFGKRGKKAYNKWKKLYKEAKAEIPDIIDVYFDGDKNIYDKLKDLKVEENDKGEESTRAASGRTLNALHKIMPNLIGGSADVAGSVITKIDGGSDFTKDNYAGKNMNYGIREFAMASVNNGILLHGGLRSYGGCFLVFSDYLKPAIRIAAISKLPNVFLFSHDTIALGEDGPTHQPIEQLAMLRSIPNVKVYRPCDLGEVVGTYQLAFADTTSPSCIILSRQNLPYLTKGKEIFYHKGAYILKFEEAPLSKILVASGSEVSLAMEVAKDDPSIRVVSMLSMELYDKQDFVYKEATLGKDKSKVVAIEMLSEFGWYKYADHVYSFNRFGYSGKPKDILKKAKFTAPDLKFYLDQLK